MDVAACVRVSRSYLPHARMRQLILLAVATTLCTAPAGNAAPDDGSPFVRKYYTQATQLAADGQVEAALAAVARALERDPNDLPSLRLQADLALRQGDQDLAVHTLHAWLHRARTTRPSPVPAKAIGDAEKELLALDPDSRAWSTLASAYVRELLGLAKDYERRKDLLAALAVYRHVQQVDAENAAARAAIADIRRTGGREVAVEDVYAGGGDPTAGLSETKIAEEDRKHADWDTAWTKDTDNYGYRTNAGFLVLETSAIAMEQMNRFYRRFFRFKEDGGKTPKIEIRIFKNRDEYLKLGANPAPWSGGHFIGSAVETYIGGTTGKESIRDMYRTLFHEAAHQFVSLAIPFVPGWLNEAYASFFEGCSILSNGSVDWNKPATHRLFPLAARLDRGFMTSADDGVKDAAGEWAEPQTAPTLRIVIAGDYQWGPPWYAPTWGVVYFLYNYRDDKGRAVYRDALHEYAQSFKRGRPKDPIAHFEEVVLAPATSTIKTVDELTPVWRAWLLELRDRATGKSKGEDELVRFGDAALERGDKEQALAFFAEASEGRAQDVDLLAKVCRLLDELKLTSRAAGAFRDLKRALELRGETDTERYRWTSRRLVALDPLLRRYGEIKQRLAEKGLALAGRYEAAGLPTMALDIARRMSGDFSVPESLEYYRSLAQRTGKTLARWRVAYDEHSLAGWSAGEGYSPYGEFLRADIAAEEGDGRGFFTKQLMADVPFEGDYAIEAEMRVEEDGKGGFQGTLMGLCFGVKDSSNFHAVMLHPKGFLDISTSRGGAWQFHEHSVQDVGDRWHRLRIDVADRTLDVYLDGLYLRSLDFPTAEVVRGGFGLISGVGRAFYRHVRMLARDPNDPSARIERKLAMGRIAKDPSKRATGSFTGLAPPELKARAWVQGEPIELRTLTGRPVLLAFWSPGQDKVIPCTRYYAHLAAAGEAQGLALVVMCDGGSQEADVAAYLAEHQMPGAHVGIDEGNVTFGAYQVKGMPLVFLIGRDGVVTFQGTPGLSKGTGWDPSKGPTYLDDPFKLLLSGQ